MTHDIILAVKGLTVEFPHGRSKTVYAVSGIDFEVFRGETLGLVGESGCGKSSAARAVMQLPPPVSGSVIFCGEDLTKADGKRLRRLRSRFQMIFQDSMASLNPRRKIGRSIGMPLEIMGNVSKEDRKQRVRTMMASVGMEPENYNRRPFEFSGGQCQRIQIARALISNPELLICDEPVSSLDVSVQAQILNLLEDLRVRFGLTLVFISHDLAVVKNVCDRVAVMYLGKFCEIAPSDILYRHPRHPYTVALLNAIPEPDPGKPLTQANLLSGEIPSPSAPPSGCRFRTRCSKSFHRCAAEAPQMTEIAAGHQVACHLATDSNI